MARRLPVAVAQLGPVHLADSRAAVVRRLVALLREAHGRGARLVVFPELALTTFFPRWWMTSRPRSTAFLSVRCRMPRPARYSIWRASWRSGFIWAMPS